ncbi:sugar ABC transporter permease [Spirochaetia bacterium]|nr:sugar ABC transporter permease [Spirochaetia bacterium]
MKDKRTQLDYCFMVLPGIIWLSLFSIVPMFGIVMAFQDFIPGRSWLGSKWVGFENFKYLFSMQDVRLVINNTLIIAVSKIILNLLVPLTFALLLNEVKNMSFKRLSQTVVYLPHFISWVILASILLNIFGYTGIANTVTGLFGGQRRVFMQNAQFARNLIIFSEIWKEFGFGAVIYLATLSGINPELYEAAAIDGAGRWRSMRTITIPGLMSTIVLLAVLSLGNVLNAGFDQIFNMYNPLVYSTTDILDTYVYRLAFLRMDFSLSTAAGLFKSVISFVLIVSSYGLAYKLTDYRIF